jgi:hypothetical protein
MSRISTSASSTPSVPALSDFRLFAENLRRRPLHVRIIQVRLGDEVVDRVSGQPDPLDRYRAAAIDVAAR